MSETRETNDPVFNQLRDEERAANVRVADANTNAYKNVDINTDVSAESQEEIELALIEQKKAQDKVLEYPKRKIKVIK